MDKITIDAEDLTDAMQNQDAEAEYFLDLKTGEVLFLIDEAIVGELDDDLEERLEAEPDRYRPIDTISSSDGWQIMADFVEGLPEGRVRESLTRALTGRKPFRHFKETLIDQLEVRDQWFVFRDRKMLGVAREWLTGKDIEAELTGRIADLA